MATVQPQIRTFFLNGPAGQLEAVLNEGEADAQFAALVTHPHPMFGGTLHNKVVYHAAKALNGFGFPVLRFNFRGAGGSQGEHDQGRGEVDDVRAAVDWLWSEFGKPLLFAGFSFGAAVGLRACCADDRVNVLISLGTPVRVQDREYEYSFLNACTKPKLFVSGSLDEFCPTAQLERLVARVPDPKQLVIIQGGDHFFAGHLPEMRAAVEKWVRETVLGEAPGLRTSQTNW